MAHNSTAYYVSFRNDLPLGSIVLNLTVYINLATVGTLLGIFSTFSRNPLVERIFGFDNSLRIKDYISSFPPFIVADNIVSYEESIYYRAPVPLSLFIGDVSFVDIDLTVAVVGALSHTTSFEHTVTMHAVITTPPGKCTLFAAYLALILNFSQIPVKAAHALMEDLVSF